MKRKCPSRTDSGANTTQHKDVESRNNRKGQESSTQHRPCHHRRDPSDSQGQHTESHTDSGSQQCPLSCRDCACLVDGGDKFVSIATKRGSRDDHLLLGAHSVSYFPLPLVCPPSRGCPCYPLSLPFLEKQSLFGLQLPFSLVLQLFVSWPQRKTQEMDFFSEAPVFVPGIHMPCDPDAAER